MIDEVFLKAAVNIKRSYYDLTSNLSLYETYVAKTQELVEETLKKVTEIDDDLHDPKKRKNMKNTSVLNELDVILAKLEQDTKRLEAYIQPMNEGIERLAVEEKELYRQIKDKHPSLTDEQIVESVRERLKKEGLL